MSFQEDEIENSLKKVRRRIEHYLRNSNAKVIIKIAKICGVEVPQKLINHVESQEK
jgi:5,10-methylenetetrahydrofolate reductase